MSDIKMYQFWAIISLGTGSQIKIYIQAPDQFTATQMIKAQYGAQLITPTANFVSTNPVN